jgi:transposase-like protein
MCALDDALNVPAQKDPRRAQVIELRFFGGLSVEEAAEALRVSPQTVMRDWRLAGSMCGSARSTATWSDLVDTFRKADTMSRMPESSKGRRPRRQFDEEFRSQAVRLVLDDHKTVGAVARDLDLTPSALRLWVTRPRPIARTVVPA